MKRLISAFAFAVAASLTLAACGGTSHSNGSTSSSSSTSSGSDVNHADVLFAQSMIPHHRQAVLMARMAKRHAATTAVRSLAGRIEAAQGPEINTMAGWLRAWGKKVPSTTRDGMGGMGHDMGHGTASMDVRDMPGMMSSTDMGDLDAATGTRFDRMFLTMMIRHHRGAIEMAKTEQAHGTNQDAVALAKKIETAQTAEIATMRQLLTS